MNCSQHSCFQTPKEQLTELSTLNDFFLEEKGPISEKTHEETASSEDIRSIQSKDA